MIWKSTFVTAWIMISSCLYAAAQGYVDQDAVAPVLESQGSSIEPITPITWHVYTFSKSDKNLKMALSRLQAHLDSLPGGMQGHRLEIAELSNRVRSKYMIQRRSLLIPDSFPEDFRAYTPFPLEYAGGAEIPRLFIIDKFTQTFGAYEAGRLVRWGLVSSGHNDDLTPTGRYSFNWKQEYRESSEAPEGEVWKLRWVFNFNARKGIHVHQYQLPIAMAASHGCVRLSESDAAWNYNWASQWVMKNGVVQQEGTPVVVINHNPVGMPAHWLSTEDGAVTLVRLPDDPMSLSPAMEDRVAGP